MTSEYASKGLRLTFMPYDDLWRRERKLLHLLTQPKAASSYEPIQSQESAQLCLDILNDPSKHWGHSQRLFSSIEHLIFEHLIDLLPFLHHLPEILSPWKQYGCQVSDETLDLFGGLYRQVSGLAHSEQLPNHDHSAACFIARIESLKESYRLTDNQAIFLAGAMVRRRSPFL